MQRQIRVAGHGKIEVKPRPSAQASGKGNIVARLRNLLVEVSEAVDTFVVLCETNAVPGTAKAYGKSLNPLAECMVHPEFFKLEVDDRCQKLILEIPHDLITIRKGPGGCACWINSDTKEVIHTLAIGHGAVLDEGVPLKIPSHYVSLGNPLVRS